MKNMPENMNPARISRIICLLEEIWTRYPNLRLGQVLEIVLGRKAQIMLVVRRLHGQAEKVDIESIGPALSDITDGELEDRLSLVVDGTGNF